MRILRRRLTQRIAKSSWFIGWRAVFWLSFLLVLPPAVYAQCPPPAAGTTPGFTLDKARICVGTPVTITRRADLESDNYNFNYDGKSPLDQPPPTGITLEGFKNSFIYSKPGSFTIIQLASVVGKALVTCQTVMVMPVDPVRFTAKACSGRKVLVDVTLETGTSQYDSYVINWGDGQTSVLSRTQIATQQAHTYLNIRSYTIQITGRYGAPASCETPFAAVQSQQQTVVIAPATAQPAITALTTTGDNSIAIRYQVGAGNETELFQRDASGIFATTGQKGSSGSFLVQTNTQEVQCFQLSSQDACQTSGGSSDVVCSLVLDAKAINKRNNLTWKPYAGTLSASTQFRYYRIFRNGSPVAQLNNVGVGNYGDVDPLECGVPYCYQLEATISGVVQTVVTSAPVCVTAINGDAPNEFGPIQVSVESDQPRLVANLPSIGTSTSWTMAVSRSDGPSGTLKPIEAVFNNIAFTDKSVSASTGQYCYQLTYINKCGLSSPPSTPVCTVFLRAQSSDTLSWAGASPFAPSRVASYTLEVVDSVNNTRKIILIANGTTYVPDDPDIQTQRYRIVAISERGGISFSNFFTLQRDATIFVPNAFYPGSNTAGNNVFQAKGQFFDRLKMIIYNRWGEVIYESTDKKTGWDGTANGQPVVAGRYTYQIEVTDRTGVKTVRTGAVLLIR